MTALPRSTGGPEALGRLERRKARTRAAILRAASDLFDERGYQETSVQLISDAADVGIGTLYGYFSSKEEVLREVLRQRSLPAIERYVATAAGEGTGIERLVGLIEAYAEFLGQNRPVLIAALVSLDGFATTPGGPLLWLHGAFRQILQAGVDSGEFRSMPVDALARGFQGLCTMAMLGVGIYKGHEDEPETLEGLRAMARLLVANP